MVKLERGRLQRAGRAHGRAGWRFRTAIAAIAFAFGLGATGCASFHRGALPGEPADATFVQVGDTRVHYVDEGPATSSEAVVLLHGFASSMHTYRDVIPALVAQGHRVIALDLKGFGWTDRPPGDYSPKAQAELVFGLLDQRGVDHVSVVAHSWGSSVALSMAMASPERVERIALYDAWVYEEQLPTFFHLSQADGVGEVLFNGFYTQRPDDKVELAFYDKDLITQEMVDGIEEQLDRPGAVRAALAAVRGQRFEEMQARYRTIEQPVLLLWGREDRITTLEMGERLSKDLPHAELVVFPQCGHFPMYEAKAASTRHLQAFLAPALDNDGSDDSIDETVPSSVAPASNDGAAPALNESGDAATDAPEDAEDGANQNDDATAPDAGVETP